MSTKHTPGPWKFNVGKNSRIQGLPVIRIYSDTADDMVLDFAFANGDIDLANAALIAAAPEMLEALHHIVDQAQIQNMPLGTYNLLTKVIKKAEGRK